MEHTLFEPLKPFPLAPATRVACLDRMVAEGDATVVRKPDRYEVNVYPDEPQARPLVVNADGTIVWEYDKYDGTDTIIDNHVYRG